MSDTPTLNLGLAAEDPDLGQNSGRGECIIGVHRCGCITYANAAPEHLDRTDERALAQIMRGGGSIERLSVEDARGRPYFLVSECPHNPKGWEREIPKEPDLIRYSKVGSRNLSVV